jgi:hypothetical protein
MKMAKRVRDDGVRSSIARKAWRLAVWGALTLITVGVAILAAYSETGSQRLALGATAATASEPAGQSASRRFDGEIESRRLAEAVRALAADRDRLQARISVLERSLDDMTGSIPGAAGERPATARPGASPLQPALTPGGVVSIETTRAPTSPPPAPSVAANPGQGLGQGLGQGPAPGASPGRVAYATPAATDTGAAASTATKTEFGIDLGTASTVEGLRNLWSSVKGSHEPLLEGLRPVIAVRDGGKTGMIELRLVAGPLANASVAARLCAALAAAGLTCQPAVFDGQRLALK